MAKRLRIPKLVVNGTKAHVVTHVQPRPRVNRRSDADRLKSEPWRAKGYDRQYRRARQQVIERQQGRCKDCGRQVAVKRDGAWSCSLGGQVHHEVALRDGGGSSVDSLVLLCPSCHHKRDEERRRESRDRGL